MNSPLKKYPWKSRFHLATSTLSETLPTWTKIKIISMFHENNLDSSTLCTTHCHSILPTVLNDKVSLQSLRDVTGKVELKHLYTEQNIDLRQYFQRGILEVLWFKDLHAYMHPLFQKNNLSDLFIYLFILPLVETKEVGKLPSFHVFIHKIFWCWCHVCTTLWRSFNGFDLASRKITVAKREIEVNFFIKTNVFLWCVLLICFWWSFL